MERKSPAMQDCWDIENWMMLWDSLELSDSEDSVRPGGLACKACFWNPNNYNAQAKAAIRLMLTEYADPGCRATYFLVPNPKAEILQDDELMLIKQLANVVEKI